MSESNETNNNETTEVTENKPLEFSVKEYEHGASLVFPDGKEAGFFANTAYHGIKDGAAIAKSVADALNELPKLRVMVSETQCKLDTLEHEMTGVCNARTEAENKLAEAEAKLAKIAEATASAE